MVAKIYSPANFIKHWAKEKPNICFLRQPRGDKWQQTTWSEAYQKVAKLAAYLQKYPKNTKIGIYSNNCRDWFLVDMAILAAGLISVPIYASASETTISRIITHSEIKLVFVGSFPSLVKIEAFEKELELISIHQPINDLPFWEELIQNIEPVESFFQPNDKDIATIVYTSGTTGVPKGVVVSYRALSGGLDCIASTIDVTAEDRFLSYLPLAHIMERIAVELLSIVHGCQVSFVENLASFSSNLSNTRPTIFLSVPRIWLKLRLGIVNKFGGEKSFNRIISLPVFGKLISRWAIWKLGLSKTKYCISGGAAISTKTLQWYEQQGLTIFEAYGLSETLGVSNLNTSEERKIGTVGRVMNGCETKLAENGEILLKSVSLMDGYYKEPELTANIIQDGWFHTGDLGSIDESGYLSIRGRIKEIFKTSKGKYVSPVLIEQKLELMFSAEQCCVFGSQLAQPIAVILLKNNGQPLDKTNRLDVNLPQFEEKLSLINDSLEKHERLDALLVSTTEWNTDNGMMTPTLKIRRQQVEDFYLPLFLSSENNEKIIIVK